MAAAEPPPGWRAMRHHLDDRTPVWRYERHDGRRLAVYSAATWWGREPATAEQSAAAWRRLGLIVADTWKGGQLLSTPGATGLDLLRRSLPAGERYATLDSETQDLIRSFAGQGRIEPARDGWEALRRRVGPTLPRVEVWDMRLAYAAVAWGLAEGEPVHDFGDGWSDRDEGFCRCTVTVPDGWSHLGLVPRRGDHGWDYPATPGERWDTWLHGSEVWLLRQWGWAHDVHERILFPRSGKPLARFTQRLVRARESQPAHADRLVRAGLRAILLHSIGRLHGRPPVIVRSIPLDQADEVPEDAADVHMRDGELRWTERSGEAHDPAVSHPEWSAAIWARTRVRLVDSPGVDGVRTGAMYLHPASVVALRTDAIWTTDRPGWEDDGRPGRFTLRAASETPADTPRSLGELLALAGDR